MKLGKYKGIQIKKPHLEVTKEELDAAIQQVLQSNAQSIETQDHLAVEGDEVHIDFKGYVDGEAFQGGEATDYSLVLGSHTFIAGFEDQIIGRAVGEEFDVNVTFPERYTPELAGKDAVFRVSLKGIYETRLPEFNDEFAQKYSEFPTADTYKEFLEGQIYAKKRSEIFAAVSDELMDKVIADSEIDITDEEIESQVQSMVNTYEAQLNANGMSFQDYMSMMGKTMEDIKADLRPQAVRVASSQMVLREIVKAENIMATDDDVDKAIFEMASQYGMDPDMLKSKLNQEGLENYKEELKLQKAWKLLGDTAEWVD